MTLAPAILTLAALGLVMLVASQVRRRNMHRWLPAYFRQSAARFLSAPRRSGDPIHVLLCIADHFEPDWGSPSNQTADRRLQTWIRDYPAALGSFRDSDGRPPRHTFFYPIDQYRPEHLDALADFCRRGFGEVELHLHHDHDTAENLGVTLSRFTEVFARRHGLLGRWPNGSPAYGFVHGNWALNNARPDGRWCGVDNELDVLRATGCYADFTFPSAPDITQPGRINSLYYASGCPGSPCSHEHGPAVGSAPAPSNGLMLIQGPLRLFWPKGRWFPRVENSCLQESQPPSGDRLEQWLKAAIQVPSRPDWFFVKLHTHGAKDSNARMLLGEPMKKMHQLLADRAAQDPRFCFHYVTAREMYNLAKAAEAGWKATVAQAINSVISPPPPLRPDNPSPVSVSQESTRPTDVPLVAR